MEMVGVSPMYGIAILLKQIVTEAPFLLDFHHRTFGIQCRWVSLIFAAPTMDLNDESCPAGGDQDDDILKKQRAFHHWHGHFDLLICKPFKFFQS